MAALSLPELRKMRDALIRARIGGVKSLRDQNGEEITYKSDREMAAALANIDLQIAAMESGRSAPNVFKFNSTKGT